MRKVFLLMGFFILNCGSPDDACKKIALGSNPQGWSATGDVPISVLAISDAQGPFVQEVCCENANVEGCSAQSYTCDATTPTALVSDSAQYNDGNGDVCLIYEDQSGAVIASAWIQVT